MLCLMSWIHLPLLLLFIAAGKSCCFSRRASLQPMRQTCHIRLLCWDQERKADFWGYFLLTLHTWSSPCCTLSAGDTKWKRKHILCCFWFVIKVLYFILWLIYSRNVHLSLCRVEHISTFILSIYVFNSPQGLPKKYTTLERGPTPSRGIPMPQWSRATGFTSRYVGKASHHKDYEMSLSVCGATRDRNMITEMVSSILCCILSKLTYTTHFHSAVKLAMVPLSKQILLKSQFG